MDSEIVAYEQQLQHIQLELINCQDEEKKTSLQQLEQDIKELIELTKLSSANQGEKSPDPIEDEYKLFRSELALDEDESYDSRNKGNELEEFKEEIASLAGSKCQAPFKHAWCDEPVFHNALVFRVEDVEDVRSAEDILLRVMFTNPTHPEMKPCPYFLEGDCKFDSEKCHFSHGELVSFNSIREYKEPDFSSVEPKCSVLMKETNGLWRRAIVINVCEEKCVVKLESSGTTVETTLENVFPLDCDAKETSSSETEFSENETQDIDNSAQMMDILRKLPSGGMGAWEQFTKGIGSRIMSKMGYIHGSGLGVNGGGRVEPVPAVIYPSGKSLDHCMMLKEKAGNDQDLFKAEKKMRKVQRKHEEALNRAYEREKQRTDVFSFLNERLGQSEKPTSQTSVVNTQKALQSTSSKGLNVSSFQIAEEIKKTEKESRKLNESLKRHSISSPIHAAIRDKIRDCDNRLQQLQSSEQKISTEMQHRSDKKKLSVF